MDKDYLEAQRHGFDTPEEYHADQYKRWKKQQNQAKANSSKRRLDAVVINQKDGLKYELRHLVDVWRDGAGRLLKNGCCEDAGIRGDTYEYGKYCILEDCADYLSELLDRFDF